jgi:chromosome segregation ATPase
MSLDTIRELGGFGAITIIALMLMVAVWRLPDILKQIDTILKRILDHAHASNETALEAARIMRQTTSEALASKAELEAKFSEVTSRLVQVENELQIERMRREALDRELQEERRNRQENNEKHMRQLEEQAAKIKLLESAIAEKDRLIGELSKERATLRERVSALEKAQSTKVDEQPKVA